jgi:hypothetical protein
MMTLGLSQLVMAAFFAVVLFRHRALLALVYLLVLETDASDRAQLARCEHVTFRNRDHAVSRVRSTARQPGREPLGGEMFPIDKPDQIPIEIDRGSGDELPFYCVSATKFSILSLTTLGLYELFWFYKNWMLVKKRSGHDISPFWRAVFSPLYCYSFANTVNSTADSVNVSQRTRPVVIAAIYIALITLHRLPDPYWLIWLFSFAPLVPITLQIRTIHETVRPGFESSVGWGGWSYAALTVGGTLTALAVLGVFGPSTRALRGSEIPSSHQVTLVEAGVLEPNERIRFFYSSGLFSILEDGNLLTENRVVSYETIDGEIYVASSTYPEIRDLDVAYSESFLDDTVLTVSTLSGEQFVLIVSAEDGRDREFVSELEARLRRTRQP